MKIQVFVEKKTSLAFQMSQKHLKKKNKQGKKTLQYLK